MTSCLEVGGGRWLYEPPAAMRSTLRYASLFKSCDSHIFRLWVQLRITRAQRGGLRLPASAGARYSDIIGHIYGVGGAAVFVKPPAASLSRSAIHADTSNFLIRQRHGSSGGCSRWPRTTRQFGAKRHIKNIEAFGDGGWDLDCTMEATVRMSCTYTFNICQQ